MMHIYILTNNHRTLYIGVTNNLAIRAIKHRDASIDSFAKRYNCDRLIYVEEFVQIEDALRREKQLKNWRREKKIRLIERVNPNWETIPLG
jgi:putative endonuclease